MLINTDRCNCYKQLRLVLFLNFIATMSAIGEELPTFDCVINPYKIVDLSSAVPGVIEQVNVNRSDVIKKGQVVANLQADVEAASVELAKARADIQSEVGESQVNLTFDQRRSNRVRSLHTKDAISLQNKDDADRQVELSQKRLQQAKELKLVRTLELRKAEEQLKQKTIKATIDGVVVQKFKSAGEYVENQAILRIAQMDPLHVETIVPIALFDKITAGMKAEIRPEILTSQSHFATVSVVDPMGDPASGTLGIRLTLPNPNHQLPAGLKCDLHFLTEDDNSLANSLQTIPTNE